MIEIDGRVVLHKIVIRFVRTRNITLVSSLGCGPFCKMRGIGPVEDE